MTRLFRLPLTLLAATTVAACSEGAVAPNPDVVAGVDLSVLFAAPEAAEISAVEADWASRTPAATDVRVERDTIITGFAADLRVQIVSHEVDGNRHYGAVIAADTLTGPAPILVYAHGGDGGVAVDDLLSLIPFLGSEALRFVWVIPSFRSENLLFASSFWASEGSASPWDRDVDDALSLVLATPGVEPAADVGTVGVLGFSRGGGVALLMGARNSTLIDRVVAFFGPTDFMGEHARAIVSQMLTSSTPPLPGLQTLNTRYVRPLSAGTVTMAEARDQLVRRSAVLFADRMPDTQIHHGRLDDVVHVGHAEALIDAMVALGRSPPTFDGRIYADGIHNPISLSGAVPATVDYLTPLLATPH